MADKGFISSLFGGKDSLIKQAVAIEASDGKIDISASDPLEKFCGEVKGASSGFIRYILKMSNSTFRNQYLKSGGGADFINNISDEEVEKIAQNIYEPEDLDGATISAFSKGYTFDDIISGSNEVAVLLDIPVHISGELEVAKMNPNKARDALVKMMNHKYYVMSLYIDKAKKIAGSVNKAWGDLDDLTKVLNPAIILNYPVASERARMMDAYAKVGTVSDDAPEAAADSNGLTIADLKTTYKVLKIYARNMGARGTISELMKSIGGKINT